MKKIVIIIASVREGRKSDRVALFFRDFLSSGEKVSVEILDLMEYNFPVFTERLRFQKSPSEKTIAFAGKIKEAAGIIIVTPEYNGGYPASLKNVTDLLYDEWKRKPIAIATVSSGPFGGTQVITSLLFTLWKIGAWVVPSMFPVVKVEDSFDTKGTPSDKEHTEKRAGTFIKELFYCIDAQEALKKEA